jgi:hypothetical protein
MTTPTLIPESLPIAQVSEFYVQAFVIDACDVLPVEDAGNADGIGVYARLQDGTSIHVRDFNASSHDDHSHAAQCLAERLNELLQAGPIQSTDAHLEAAYEDRVSGAED